MPRISSTANRCRQLARELEHIARRILTPVQIMEVCGTHTVALFRHGIRGLLPEGIALLSGPGCPVCVTSVKDVDIALALSARKDVVMTTFGDMMRVQGGGKCLFDARAEGVLLRGHPDAAVHGRAADPGPLREGPESGLDLRRELAGGGKNEGRGAAVGLLEEAVEDRE